MFPGAVGARTAFRMPASRLSDVSLTQCLESRRHRRRRRRERRSNREAYSNAIRSQGILPPQLTFAKECFGWWVVTSDPLLTSAKWVAYGTEVSTGNLDDITAKVSALVLVPLLWIFYVDKRILIYLPLLCGYCYFFWIIPARNVLLRGLQQVGCLIRCSLLNFSFQLRASGFFYWIVTAFLHFVVFWSLTWSNVVSWCKELQNLIFRSLAPRAPTPVSWLVGASVSC